MAQVRHLVHRAWRELRRRSQLLAAAFSFAAPPLPTGNAAEIDVLSALNDAGANAGVSVWDWDVQRDVLRFTHRVMDNYGGDFDEAQVNPTEFLSRAIHPEDQQRYRETFIQALKGSKPLIIDYRVMHKDGVVRPIRLMGSIQRATTGPQRGRAIRVIGINVDMSAYEEKESRIEAQAKQQNLLLARIGLATEAAGIGVWDWDLVTGKLSSDTTMGTIFKDADLTGVTRAEDFVKHIVHPEDRAPFLEFMKHAVSRKGGDRVQTRFRYIRLDGGVHHVQLHGRIVRNDSGTAQRFLGISWNITAQVEADAEIARQTQQQALLLERLNLATETAGIDVWDWDLLTDRFTADTHMAEAYGRKQIDLQNARELIARIVHPEDVANYLAAIDIAIKSGSPLLHRYRMVLPDGSLRHVQVKARVLHDSEGKPVRLLGTSQNKTDEVEHLAELSKQAAEERMLRDRLDLATQTARISVWDQDMVNGTFNADERFWQLFGITTPEKQYRVQDGIHPDNRKQALAPVVAAFADPTQTQVSIRHRANNPTRETQYVQTHMRVFRDSTGIPVRLLGVTWDVTEEVEATEKLRKQAESDRAWVARLDIATEAAGISAWEFDLKSRQFSWHGKLQPVYGLDDTPLENLSAALAKIVYPDDLSLYKNGPAEAIARGDDRYMMRFRVFGKDGEIYYMQTAAKVMIGYHGKPRRLVGVTWNVTNEVKNTERLEQAAEHERALVERLNHSTLAAGIAPWEFDLRTNQFSWHGTPRPVCFGLDDVPMEDYFRAIHDITLPEDQGILIEGPTRNIENNIDNYQYAFRVNGVDGEIHHMQNYARVMRNKSGRARYIMGVTLDVTKEVRASELLRQQAEQERALLDRLNVTTQAAGISPWEFDLKLNQYTWFGARLSVLGLDNQPLDTYYDALREVLLPEDRNILHDAVVEAINNGVDVYSARYRARGTDGRVHYMKNFVRVLRSQRGTPYRLVGVTWDVSEEVAANERLQQQAEQQLKLTERLNIATDAAGISSWEIDLVSREFLWIENPIQSVRRVAEGGMSLDKFSDRVVPEDRVLMGNAIKAALAGKSDRIKYVYRSYMSDNRSVVHIQTFARIILNELGRVIRVLGVSWDITKEVEAATLLGQQTEQLRSVERRLERASLSSSEGHWEAELANGHLWCSSSFHALLGYREGEIDNRVSALDRLVHADDLAAYHHALSAHLATNAPYDIETRMRTNNGEYRWFRMRGMAERDADGKSKLMAGSIHDIHQQRLVEDALKLAQRRFERAINGTQDGLWELDIPNDTTWCSPRLALLLGYPATQLDTGNFLRSLMHPEDAPKIVAVARAHYRDNAPFDIEIRLRTRAGEHRWYRARASAERDAKGRALRLSGSLQDVTEARAARDDLLRATEAAEAASRAKSSFLANVSHEIRTPMNGIIGMTGLLIDTPLDRTQREYADTIRSSADSLLTVINDILDFSKIEAGKLDLESIELDLRANVEDVGAMMAFQAASKGLELIINVHPEISEHVLGDPQRLRQCLINLVGNAIKFTKQGEIVIDVCVVGRHEGRVLTHFEVRDTGIGIAQDTLKGLFQPFVQADSSTTRHFGGTGLGLSIVRRLVELMGGQVGVVSEVGKGSAFFFTLSLEPVETTTLPREVPHVRHGNILIVDDNTTNQRVLSSQLSHAGYDVTAVGSGSQALDLLLTAVRAQRQFDMVITDFQMPDMDGAMLGERIVQVPALANTRLVMLTSLDRQGDTPRLAALGFAAYLTKPVRIRELLDCVARVLGGEARQWQMEIRPMITRNSLSQAKAQQRFAGRVLVVEDNIVNQKVAVRFLERMGCTVEVADHGADGVAAFQKSKFNLILMDLQMPVMDGITATRKIRELETGKRIPIVALTANAMRGDQARCEAAGMDGFLTKPIEVERLRDALTKFGLGIEDIAASAAKPDMAVHALLEKTNVSPPQFAAPVDLARINEITDGDAEFARELVATFIASGEQQLLEIDAAIEINDRETLAKSAHKLKGACANIHAQQLRALALRLETASSTANSVALQACSAELKHEFERVRVFLSDPSVVPEPIKAVS